MKRKNLYITGALLSLGMMTGLAGCGSNTSDTKDAEAATTGASADTPSTGSSEDSKKAADKDTEAAGDSVSAQKMSATTLDTSDLFSKRDLDWSYDEAEAEKITLSGTSASVSGSGATVGTASDGAPTVTVSKAGTYVVSGTLSDGQIIVDAGDEDKVQLVLAGVTMTNQDSACIYVKNADKVFVTLADGTVNTLSDTGEEFVQTDEDTTVDGVIYARDDICFNGTGTLNVNAKYKHAIVGKDDLKVTAGTYVLSATNKGISANDSIRIKDGTFTVNSGDDALHTSNGEEEGRGYIYIAGGSFDITAGDDGIHAETDLVIDGGKIEVKESKEGLEGYTITINDGEIQIVSKDDGLNAAGGNSSEGDNFEMGGRGKMGGQNQDGQQQDGQQGGQKQDGQQGGRQQDGQQGGQKQDGQQQDGQQGGQQQDGQQSGQQQDGQKQGGQQQDGQQQDGQQKGGRKQGRPDFGNGEMPEMPNGEMPDFENGERPEMPNGEMPDMQGGDSDSAGKMQGFPGRMGGGMMMDADEKASLTINGGTVYVNAGGDGLDSNGYLTINGGVIYVSGPTNAGNGALDSGIELTVNGGSIIAAGSTGMDETFGNNSKQYSINYNFSSVRSGGTEVQLLDSDGVAIMKYTPEKEYSSVVFSSADIKEGTYTVKAGSTTGSVTVSEIVTKAKEN